jgi:SAM-dependent methyltransferase
LDVGAGRGGRVAWLLENGYDAVGVEIDEGYVENGRAFLPHDRLIAIDPIEPYPLADASFDVVLSNQVFEHVADLDALAREVARVTRPGGLGLHVFPAKWRPVEGHMNMPLVHWAPKGPVRRAAIRAALAVGAAAPYFRNLPARDRARVFARFSEDETFYRSSKEIAAILERHGLMSDFSTVARDKLAARHLSIASPLYTLLRAVYLATAKPG